MAGTSMTPRIRVSLVVWLMLLVGLFALPVAGGLYEARTMEGSCLEDVRQPTSASGEAVDWDVRARISSFPLGLECTFTDSSGDGVVVGPGWLLTFFAGAASVFGLGALTALFWPGRRPVPARSSPTSG